MEGLGSGQGTPAGMDSLDSFYCLQGELLLVPIEELSPDEDLHAGVLSEARAERLFATVGALLDGYAVDESKLRRVR